MMHGGICELRACASTGLSEVDMAGHDIMTVEEVAEYLRVSERTVYEWAQKGEIPAGKLGTTWRFKRSEIERWIDKRLMGARRTPASQPFTIANVLSRDRVVLMDETHKEPALKLMADVIARSARIRDRNELERAVFAREDLMSTGIGFSVAVPHVRLASVTDLVMAVGVSRHDIGDYESLDGRPVRIICMVAAGTNQHADYIRCLAAVSERLKDPVIRESVLNASSEQAVFDILTQ
jgi:PTS system nitrogen regulatory IIA component